jgi:hypothetical protein
MNLPSAAEELRHRLQKNWLAEKNLTFLPDELVEQLMADKYTNVDWIRRR